METKLLKKGTKFNSACITNKEIVFSDMNLLVSYPLHETIVQNIEFIEDNIFKAEMVQYDFNFYNSIDLDKIHPDEIKEKSFLGLFKWKSVPRGWVKLKKTKKITIYTNNYKLSIEGAD